jgi:putative FmdB family regulatory protein
VPTYQYACTTCDERLEVVQRFTDDPLTECAHCGGRLRKVFSPVGIVFKGSGFYRTDSRNGSSADGSKDRQPGGSASSSGDASKPESTGSAKPSGETGAGKKSEAPAGASAAAAKAA